MEFTEKEKWIAVTTVMKTAQSSKMLSKDQRDQLFLQLVRDVAPNLTNEDRLDIEQNINKLANDIQVKLASQVMEFLGDGSKKEAFDQTEKLIGKEATDKVKERLQEINDDKLK